MSGIIVCPICLEKIGETEPKSEENRLSHHLGTDLTSSSTYSSSTSQQVTGVQVTECGHIFHSKCLKDWMVEGKSICPTCRRLINTHKIITVFPQFLNSDISYDAELPQNIQKQLKRTINYSLEEIQTSICRLESHINQASVLPHSSQRRPVSSVQISQIDRIAEIVKRSEKQETSLEKEIADLKVSIQVVNNKINVYGDKVSQLTGVEKDKKAHKELVDALARINRLVSEDQALRYTLDKRVSQLKPKICLTMLNEECNKLSSVLGSVTSQNYRMQREIQIILQEFEKIKRNVAKILENYLCL